MAEASIKGNLKAHHRRHIGEKPFQRSFDGCNYRSYRKAHVTSHYRTHSGENPYKC